MKSIFLLLTIFILSFGTIAKAEQEWRFDINKSFNCKSRQFTDATQVYAAMGDSHHLNYLENVEGNKGVYQTYYNYAKCILDGELILSDQREQRYIIGNAEDVMLKLSCFTRNIAKAKTYYDSIMDKYGNLLRNEPQRIVGVCKPLYMIDIKTGTFIPIRN